MFVVRAGWVAALIWQDRVCDPESEDERERRVSVVCMIKQNQICDLHRLEGNGNINRIAGPQLVLT